ncbi:hypothetical protein CHLRE_03g175100v5 [Chlamydomonas reinhardtii]|uniref:PNPLA domain-containing protein n=1 Tax=Chlamydomonas reinhardtii TaxID=3055 RepID=A0A2K3DXD2_CHLRE|nr:uncharacterized protein CHLRE_03g175100v5 [Chlamydomonas reinhardtii]PNW85181.1 hypothetical protein CHLRE_03g175100v5 [Chlamydomonas reinhardtii]
MACAGEGKFTGKDPAALPTLVVRFSGSGWLLAFHCGVGKFAYDHLRVDHPRLRFGGQSGGSLISSALTAGMDVDCVYEASLMMIEPCKHNPFRMRKCLNEALDRLAPPDEAWIRAKHRLIVGMSRIEHLGGAKIAWKSTNLTEFRGRAHGLRVLEASCHLPVISGLRGVDVDGHRFFDGGVAELVPDITPEQIGLNSDPAKGPVDPVFSIDICSWGNLGEGYHICPGFDVPVGWFFFPHNSGVLNKLFRLGYARAAECFAKVDPAIMADLWRPGMELSLSYLPGICEQVDELVSYLREADPFCCIDAMLSSRKKYSKPQLSRLAQMHIPQLPMAQSSELLPLIAKAELSKIPGPVDGGVKGGAQAVPEAAQPTGQLRVAMPHTPALAKEQEEQEQRRVTANGRSAGAAQQEERRNGSGTAAGGDASGGLQSSLPAGAACAGTGHSMQLPGAPPVANISTSAAADGADGCTAARRGSTAYSVATPTAVDAAAALMSGSGSTASLPAVLAAHLGAGSDYAGSAPDSPCAAAGPPRHSLRPMPPLRPTTWLKDDSLRTASLQNMAKRGSRVAPLPPLMGVLSAPAPDSSTAGGSPP